MFVDKNDAFRHNSCKKLAQLAKVVTSMRNLELDRDAERVGIRNQYEEQIGQLRGKYLGKYQEIHSGLIQYRKDAIQEACNSYGQLYKQMKNEYLELVDQQTQSLTQIAEELKKCHDNVDSLKNQIQDSSSKVNKASHAFKQAVKSNQKSINALKTEAISQCQPYTSKTTAAQAEFDKKSKSLTAKHNKEVKEIKGQIQELLSQTIQNKRTELSKLYDSIDKMKEECNDYRRSFSTAIEEHLAISKTTQEKILAIVKAMNEQVDAIGKQKTVFEKQNEKIHEERTKELNELSSQFKKVSTNHTQIIDSYTDKIKKQQQQLIDFDKTQDEAKKRLINQQHAAKKNIESNFKSQETTYNQLRNNTTLTIEKINRVVKNLMNWTKDSIDFSKEKLNNKNIGLKNRINQYSQEKQKQYNAVYSKILDNQKQRLELVERTFDRHQQTKDSYFNELLHMTKSMNDKMKQQGSKNQKMLDNKQSKINKEIEEYQNGLKSREESRENELLRNQEKGKSDRHKKLISLHQKFNSEVGEKKDSLNNSKKAAVDYIVQNYQTEASIEKETESFNLKKAQTLQKIDFMNKQIEIAREEGRKTANKYQNEMSNLDKTIRQLQRRKETETRTIDEEYEMKIQVCQVDLQKSIENISKLYNKGENEKGTVIIEAIRKVRDTRNRVDTFISKKKREIEDLHVQNSNEIKKLTQELDDLKTNEKESELKQKIKEKENDLIKKKAEIERMYQNKFSMVNAAISKTKEDSEEQQQKLVHEACEKQKAFGDATKQIDAEKAQLEQEKTQSRQEINSKYDQIKAEISSKYQVEAEKMKNRIEDSRNKRDELLMKQKEQLSQMTDDLNDVIKDQIEQIHPLFIRTDETMNQNLIDLIADLKSMGDQKAAIEDSANKDKEVKLKQKCVQKLESIGSKTDALVKLLLEGPDIARIQARGISQGDLLPSTPPVISVSKSQTLKSPKRQSSNNPLPPLVAAD